jgi:hypothetical protein
VSPMGVARIALAMLMVATLMLQAAHGTLDFTPEALTLTVLPDGATKVEYTVESNPSRVRITVQLFGAPFINMVIRDEAGNPLDASVSGGNVTVDSIGASQLRFSYLSRSLVSQEGPTWSVNVTSMVETRVVLPEGAALFDMSDVPLDIGAAGNCQYIDFTPGDISVYFIMGLLRVEDESRDIIDKTEKYMAEKEVEGYVFSEAHAALDDAKDLFEIGEYVDSKNKALDALEVAMITVDRGVSATDEVEKAQMAVNQAVYEGRTIGLSSAETSLALAKTLCASGEYIEATAEAAEAYRKAVAASKAMENSFNGQIVVSAAVLAVVGYFFFKNL